jgi:putative transposase
MPRIAPQISLSRRMRRLLEAKERAHKTSQHLAERIRIILKSAEGQLNRTTAEQLGVDSQRVSRWRRRWSETEGQLKQAETKGATDKELEALLLSTLSDQYRCGVKPKFTAEQMAQIIAVACEDPAESGFVVSHWTPKEVAAEAIRRGIVESISVRHVDRFLKGGRASASQEQILADVQRQAGGPGTVSARRREGLHNLPACPGTRGTGHSCCEL